MKNVLLVVGNGFDLNIGLKTSYNDFIGSIKLYKKRNEFRLTVDESSINFDDEIYNESYFDFEGNYFIDEENEIIKVKKNYLIQELKGLHEIDNWVDLEYMLGVIAKNNFRNIEQIIMDLKMKVNINPSNFIKDEYDELKLLLKEYLKIQSKKLFSDLYPPMWDKDSILKMYNKYNQFNSFKTLKELMDTESIELTILNFNYTYSLIYLMDFIRTFKRMNISSFIIENSNTEETEITVPHKHIFAHGNIRKEIVFGIDDKENVEKQYIFLHKSFDKLKTNTNVPKLLNDSAEIVFFGSSLGKTDESYFDDFFKNICIYNDKMEKRQKRLMFFYYKYDGYVDIFNRLIELTNHNTAKLKHNNNIQFIDSSY